jgi:NRAMP (natural resistance-associated macrophage protein)-like metal ion transporter
MSTTKFKKLKKLLRDLGPGIITGAADNDPSGISTYSIVGATTGFSQLWLLALSSPLLINIQSICARIGDVTKKGLSSAIEAHFGHKITLVATLILVFANTATLGADFIGLGAALHIIFPMVPTLVFLPLVALFFWYLIVFRSYEAIRKMLLLLSLVFVTYILSGIMVVPDWGMVLKNTFLPQVKFRLSFWLSAVAMLGTTISPFLLYWQTSEEIEENRTVKDAPLETKRIAVGMIIANIVAYFIIITCASVFYFKGIKIENAADAALALRPIAGDYAYLLFALGILGSGFLAIPVIASSAAYAVAATFRWKEGLSQKISKAKGFYSVFTAVFVFGLLISFLGIHPIKVLFYSQVINGLATPPLLALVVVASSSQKIMGQYKNGLREKLLGWLAVGVMTTAALAMFLAA